MKKLIYIFLFAAMTTNQLEAQNPKFDSKLKKSSKAWEFGLGATVLQFNRVSMSNFTDLNKDGYVFDLKLDQAVFGGNLYVARELSPHIFIDLQGAVGVAQDKLNSKTKNHLLYMIGPGLQWRLGEYFNSKYIDPYLRAGVSFMYKEFDILYAGTEGMSPDQMSWYLSNIKNKEGADRNSLVPISVGAGLNMWFNDNWGIGMQGDYLIMPHKDVANSLQASLRVMYRLGGGSKKAQPMVEYIDRIEYVDRVVEKMVPAIIPAPVVKEKVKMMSLENIHFEFDRAILTAQSELELDTLANILQQDLTLKYLITGYTDSKGTGEYNLKLSTHRAQVVVQGLINRGIPESMLIARGVGSKIAFARPDASNEVRQGDRKIMIEEIKNIEYWNYLQQN